MIPNKTRCTLELPPLSLRVLRLATFGHDASRCLDTCPKRFLDRAVFAPRRRIGKLEVRLFNPALSIKAKGEIFNGNWFAGKHSVKHRFENFARFCPHLHTRLTQCSRVFVAEDRGEGIVVNPCALRPPRQDRNIGCVEASNRFTRVLSACGHPSGGPRPCRTVCATPPRPRLCKPLSILTSKHSPRSNRRAAMGAIDTQ